MVVPKLIRADDTHGGGLLNVSVQSDGGLHADFFASLAENVTANKTVVPPLLVSRIRGDLIHDEHVFEKDFVVFWEAPVQEWILLMAVVVALVMLESRLFARYVTTDTGRSFKFHFASLCCWTLCGLGFNLGYAFRHGTRKGIEWFSGYFIEWMLSIDNLFAFQVIFRAYCAPLSIQHKALFCGILGSVLARLLLFLAFGNALNSIHYIQFLFGILLIYSGVSVLNDDDTQPTPELKDVYVVKLLKKAMGNRLKENYGVDDGPLFVVEDGRMVATLLVPLILSLESVDILFAVDSVSAKVSQFHDQFLAYSSSVMALLGLRAMYFLLDDVCKYFSLLKYGVCVILVFIGLDLMMSSRYAIPEWVVCIFIVTVFNLCVLASILVHLAGGEGVLPTLRRDDSKAAIGAGQATIGSTGPAATPAPRKWKMEQRTSTIRRTTEADPSISAGAGDSAAG